MGQLLHCKIETWGKQLLDFGKRNSLINFKDGKRSNIKLITPSFDTLFDLIVVQEKSLAFPFAKENRIDDNGEESYSTIIKGDIDTQKQFDEQQKTLKALRYKANVAIEERGVNILFLAFGLLNWKEREDSDLFLSSPIILVPVKLTIENLASPYVLVPHEDEIVINPTLSHKLENDFGIVLPEFDGAKDDIGKYFESLTKLIKAKDWNISETVYLTTLSFLKINMYKDLERNEEKLNSNPIISAIAGESESINASSSFNNFDHDKEVKPIDTFQVVDADSSQQDAILLSKRGLSFVLQGPPGTGKSQTITNIISEALADGRKVLFVSEKRAALEVVYKRLSNVGLSDFCFSLHSYKANKKEILRDLENSISIDRKKVREEALSQLEILNHKRNILNEYQEELHTPCSGLKCSIFYVNGKLAKFENIPDIIFEIQDVKNTTQVQLSERICLLDEFAKTVGKRSEDYTQNVWRNSTVKYLSNEQRHDIDSNISLIVPILSEIHNNILTCCNDLSITVKPSLDGLHILMDLLNLASKSPLLPTKWFFNEDINVLINDAKQYQKLITTITTIKSELSIVYKPNIYSINAQHVIYEIKSNIKNLKNKLNEQNCDLILSNANKYISQIDTITPILDSAFSASYKIAELLDIKRPSNSKEINSLLKFVDNLCVNVFPTEQWFDESSFAKIKKFVPDCKNIHDEIIALRQSILSNFDKEIFNIDFYPILKRFRGEYNSFFKVFKKSYRDDIKLIQQYSSNGVKLSFEEAFILLKNLKTISDKVEDILKNKELYLSYFGTYYNGEDTEWSTLKDALNKFDCICLFDTYMSNKVKQYLLNCSIPNDELIELSSICKKGCNNDIIFDLNSNISSKITETTPCDCLQKDLFLIRDSVDNLSKTYTQIIDTRNDFTQFETVTTELQKLVELQISESELQSKEDQISIYYDNFYTGLTTNWDKLFQALYFVKDFKTLIEKTNLPDSFIYKICSDSKIVSYCKYCANNLEKLFKSIEESLIWILGLFEESELLTRYNLDDLCNRFIRCKDKKYLLEEWVDYCSNKKKCEEVGLTPYLIQVEEKSIDTNLIVDVYLKRFYHLWLDVMLPQFPAVLNFRSRIHNQEIKDFCELDKTQFKIAQSRVREIVSSRIPDFNAITSTRDEIGILKREINKQRRLMPLRKLFNEIPNLLTALKPCFMMSPLSVSVFLEAQSYDFDMVIFDEASQVHTEDAVGAIMRGKQVIIVGDIEQLPPTDFFTSSLDEDDFDNDKSSENSYNDAGAYESILSEALTVLPERSLLWHYRSRNEDLIAFSNFKIYKNSLITFPSATEKAPDFGVEYIYMPNGVYEHGKRTNIIEAKKVADLVFEHFKKYPKRSLGVITFSEAQRQAVDAAIRFKRNQNAMYEEFFLEDTDESFFIKNLENVQGDERDTIIFSICYGKDCLGKTNLDFGPINREGGYRRLNVAITRAKYNVKLVGSIVPTDIDLNRTSAKGMKLLRSYIEFAQQGVVALKKELSYNDELQFDSPFEEAVYNFLVDKGYNVATQVGCSGFRIDMAIKHPALGGCFACGIECDGATYHSSRTARERDRLRQDVLEDMGWTIYRIWSTDWIKDQKTEGLRLINFIEKSLINQTEEVVLNNNQIDENMPQLEIEEDKELSGNFVDNYGFIPYEQVDINAFTESDPYKLIKMVIEQEQPIHFEELCRRVAPIFGNKKATSKVRAEVQHLFKWKLAEEIVRKDDFIKLKDYNDIQVRVPNNEDDYIRPIAYICNAELAKAMGTIAKYSYGITPEDLVTTTAREFGFKRTGENIVYTLREVYKDLLKDERVRELDGKVLVK